MEQSSKGSVEMRTSFARIVKEESGATAIKYGLIAAGIAVAISTAVQALGGTFTGIFEDVNTKLGGN